MAVAKYHYYGVNGDNAWHLQSHESPMQFKWYQPALFKHSDLVWCQGPQGGVRLVYQNWGEVIDFKFRKHGYITKDEEAMKEFAWVKLRAQDLIVK